MPALVNCAAVFFFFFLKRCHLFLPASPNYGAWLLNGQSGCDCVSSLWKSCYCFSDLELHVFNLTIICHGGATPDRQNDLSWTASCRISFALWSALYRTCMFNPARCCYIYSFLAKTCGFLRISTVTYVIHIMHNAAYGPDRLKEWNNKISSDCSLIYFRFYIISFPATCWTERALNINANMNVCASIP